MERAKGGGVLKYAGGYMVVIYGEVLMKGGRFFPSIWLSWWVMVL